MADIEKKSDAAAEGSRVASCSDSGTDSAHTPRITVIGVGNTLMGDDGIGVNIVDGLEAAGLDPQAEIVMGFTAGMALTHYFLESDLVIVVDAIDTEAEPGAIFRFHPDEAGIMNLRSNNIHGMGVPYLVTTARLKGVEPEVLVFAVQVGSIAPDDGQLTPPVEQAATRVRELIVAEVAARLASPAVPR